MSWLSRLFGGDKPAPEPPAPPLQTVVIPDELAAELLADAGEGADLTAVVVASLRDHREAQRKAAEALARGERIPFWLRREKSDSDIEDQLRERVTLRRAGEVEATGVSVAPAPAPRGTDAT